MGKKAEMGVGTLIIFISMLLVAAVAAGVLIQTVGSLQEKALMTGQQAKTQIATNINVVEISATDGRNRSLRDFSQLVKLSPGSGPVKLAEMLLTLNTYAATSTLKFRGIGAPIERSNLGYNTWSAQEFGVFYLFNWTNSGIITYQLPYTISGVDLDGDGINENVSTCRPGRLCPAMYDNEYIKIRLSGNLTDYYVQMVDTGGSPVSLALNVDLANDNTPIGDGLGYVSSSGTTPGFWNLNPSQIIITRQPSDLNDDLDDDQGDDSVVINATHAIVRLSTVGEIPVSFGTDLGVPGLISVEEDLIVNGTKYGNLVIDGTTTQANRIDENVTFTITPEADGSGYFVVEYLEQGSNFVDGNLQRGDLARLYFEAPVDIGEDEEVRINLIPKTGTAALSIFMTPSVISTERVYLYP